MRAFVSSTVAFVVVVFLRRDCIAVACSERAFQSYDGTCNNVEEGYQNYGSNFQPFLYLVGQEYKRGPDEVLRFAKTVPHNGGENTYAAEPATNSPRDVCSPTGSNGRDMCQRVGTLLEHKGISPGFTTSPRKLSQHLHSPQEKLDDETDAYYRTQFKTATEPGVSLLVPFFGQFLSHDVFGDTNRDLNLVNLQVTGIPNMNDATNPAVVAGISLEEADVFTTSSRAFQGASSPFSFPTSLVPDPIPVAVFYEPDGTTVRKLEFANTRTAWLDLDGVYGMEAEIVDYLRERNNGRLKVHSYSFEKSPRIPGNFTVDSLPPPVSGLPSRELRGMFGGGGVHSHKTPLFADPRNSENLSMGIVHVAFHLYHNVLAEDVCLPLLEQGLLEFRESRDETLFQCARRRNIATWQHIVLDEYLPVLTGRKLPDYKGYNPRINPNLSVEADIAFRLHNSCPRDIPLVGRDGQLDSRIDCEPIPSLSHLGDPKPGHIGFSGTTFNFFPDGFFAFLLGKAGHIRDQGGLSENPYHQVLRGLCFSESGAFNEEVDGALRNIPGMAGVDVPAFTLRRLQQLGISTYVQARKFLSGGQDKIYGNRACPLSLLVEKSDKPDQLGCFSRLTGDKKKARKLRNGMKKAGMLPKVANVPLWTGMMYEKKSNGGGVLGRMQAWIVMEQMKRVRDGDRFYYRNMENSGLTVDEIRQVERTKMSTVLRAVFGNEVGIQDDVFVL